jgi:hypothetical protein
METKANNFEKAGILERLKLQSFYLLAGITGYCFTSSSSYAKVDSFFEKNGQQYVVEAKVRNNKLTDYPTHILQLDKYKELQEWYAKGYKALYINFFEDGVIVYNLSTRIAAGEGNNGLEFAARKCRTNTVNGGSEIMRSAAYIKANEAQWKDRVYRLND